MRHICEYYIRLRVKRGKRKEYNIKKIVGVRFDDDLFFYV